MGLSTFQNFISNNNKYKKYSNSVEAENVYNYLTEPENIEKMIATNDSGAPALLGVQGDIEIKFGSVSGFSFKENFVKQCIGAMVREILEPFGYESNVKMALPKTGLYFKTAMNYSKVEGKASCKLARKLVVVCC